MGLIRSIAANVGTKRIEAGARYRHPYSDDAVIHEVMQRDKRDAVALGRTVLVDRLKTGVKIAAASAATVGAIVFFGYAGASSGETPPEPTCAATPIDACSSPTHVPTTPQPTPTHQS